LRSEVDGVREFFTSLRAEMDKFRDLGAIPKAFISDDEMAILRVLRHVNEADALRS
jgi:hypothetical protein